MSAERQWTKPRLRGLHVLAAGRENTGFYSNVTREPAACTELAALHGTVYWQTADWLIEQGLAEWDPRYPRQRLRLTTAGKREAGDRCKD